MRSCSYCAERIQDAAIICRFCGRDVTPVSGARPAPQGPSIAWLIRVVALLVLVTFLFVGLLYAYRAQSPSALSVPISQAISEIQSGQVKSVTINGDQATLDLRDGIRQATTVGRPSDAFEKVLTDYNGTHDKSQAIAWSKQQDSQTFGIIGPVLLSLLPVLLIGALVVYGARLVVQARRRR